MATQTSDPSEVQEVTLRPAASFLRVVGQPTMSVRLDCHEPLAFTRRRSQAVLDPPFRPDPIVQTVLRKMRAGSLVATVDAATRAGLDDVLDLPSAVLSLQQADQVGTPGDLLYLIVVDEDTAKPVGKVPDAPYDVTIPYREVRRPATSV